MNIKLANSRSLMKIFIFMLILTLAAIATYIEASADIEVSYIYRTSVNNANGLRSVGDVPIGYYRESASSRIETLWTPPPLGGSLGQYYEFAGWYGMSTVIRTEKIRC